MNSAIRLPSAARSLDLGMGAQLDPYIDWLDAHDPADASAAMRPKTKGNPLP